MTQSTNPDSRLIGQKEFAELIGVSLATLNSMRKAGVLPPHTTIGERALRWSESAALDFLKSWIGQTSGRTPDVTAPDPDPTLAISRTMTPPQVARILQVKSDTVRTWIRSGELRGFNVAAPSAQRPRFRVRDEDLQEFMERRELKPAQKSRRRARRSAPSGRYF